FVRRSRSARARGKLKPGLGLRKRPRYILPGRILPSLQKIDQGGDHQPTWPDSFLITNQKNPARAHYPQAQLRRTRSLTVSLELLSDGVARTESHSSCTGLHGSRTRVAPMDASKNRNTIAATFGAGC